MGVYLACAVRHPTSCCRGRRPIEHIFSPLRLLQVLGFASDSFGASSLTRTRALHYLFCPNSVSHDIIPSISSLLCGKIRSNIDGASVPHSLMRPRHVADREGFLNTLHINLYIAMSHFLCAASDISISFLLDIFHHEDFFVTSGGSLVTSCAICHDFLFSLKYIF